MATNFPTSLDSLTNPTSSDSLNSPSHSAQHANANDAIEALQAKVGVDSSAVTSSHDYLIADHASRITTLEGATTGSLVHISRTTVGSAVSSVTVSGAFSSDYDNYKILYSGGATSTVTDIDMVLGASSTGYYSVRVGWRYTNSAGSFVDANNGNSWRVGSSPDSTPNINIDVMGPNLAGNTFFQGIYKGFTLVAATGGYHDDTTQHTAFTLSLVAGTFTGGYIDVYGYAKA